jgi:DNA-directed RNA polymerase subunit E'/Rpb7
MSAAAQDLYDRITFEEKVILKPSELGAGKIDETLLNRVRDRLEGKCCVDGFVKPGSMSIKSKSMGHAAHARFTGDFVYILKLGAEVLNPPQDTEVDVEVIKTNVMGVYTLFDNAMRVLLPQDLHRDMPDIQDVKEGDRVRVKIVGVHYEVNDPQILAVGRLVRVLSSN